MQVRLKLAWFERTTGELRSWTCSQPVNVWLGFELSVQVVDCSDCDPGPLKETVKGWTWMAPSLRSQTYWSVTGPLPV